MKSMQLCVIGIAALVVAAAVIVYVVTDNGPGPEGPGSLSDAAGNEISLSVNVQTITAASPSIADIVCYMGYGSNIVAVSTSCTHPDIPSGTTTVGPYTNPNTDGISTANADVTFIDGSNMNAVTAYNTLRSAGMNVVMMYGSRDTIDGVYKNVEIVGRIMRSEHYQEIIGEMRATVAMLKAATNGAPHTRILVTTGLASLATDTGGNFTNLAAFTGAGVYVAGIDSAINSMISEVSRMTTPASGSGWAAADTDFLSTSTGNVDLLIVLWTNKASMPNATAINDLLTKMKGTGSPWANCKAVKDGNIVFIGGDAGSDLSRVTPYTVYKGLSLMSLYVNPGCYSATPGGAARSLGDLPQCVDNSNLAALTAYTENRPA